MKMLPIVVVMLLLAGELLSCKSHYPTETKKCDTCSDTTHHPCDTCNINQDSLQRIKDSLSHAWVWTEYTIPGETNLTGVWVFGPDDIYLVGNNLYRFDGSSFHQIHTRDSTHHVTMDGAMNGYSIFAFDTNDYWLIHYGGDAVHSLTNGVFEDFRPGQTNACWGPSSHDLFVVGNAGQIHHYDGTTFTDMVSPTTKNLLWVWGTSHNDVWATGYNSSTDESALIHYDGSNWSEDQLSTSGKTRQYGIGGAWACDSNGHKFVAISGTKVLRKTDNGEWRLDTSNLHNDLTGGGYDGIGIYGNTPDDMMAIGGWGYVGHWNGKTWRRYDQLFDENNNFYGPGAFSMNGNTACVVGVKSGKSWVAIGRRAK